MNDREHATTLATAAGRGDSQAVKELLPLVYGELRALAGRYLAHRQRVETLQPTALVHEAYVRLVDDGSLDLNGRTHFFAVAAQAMRWVIADHVRGRMAAKRGGAGDWQRVTLSDAPDSGLAEDIDMLSLHEVLDRLAERDERAYRVVELRFLGGLSVEQTAQMLNISPKTVKNDWRWTRAWLLKELAGAAGD